MIPKFRSDGYLPEGLHFANDWVEFFSRTREVDGRRKGLVEIEL